MFSSFYKITLLHFQLLQFLLLQYPYFKLLNMIFLSSYLFSINENIIFKTSLNLINLDENMNLDISFFSINSK